MMIRGFIYFIPSLAPTSFIGICNASLRFFYVFLIGQHQNKRKQSVLYAKKIVPLQRFLRNIRRWENLMHTGLISGI